VAEAGQNTLQGGIMTISSNIGLFRLDDAWILCYPDPNSERIISEHFDMTDRGIIELLYSLKENCLGHYNGKHNDHNIIIKRVKVKK
jgi:hypothetical protein